MKTVRPDPLPAMTRPDMHRGLTRNFATVAIIGVVLLAAILAIRALMALGILQTTLVLTGFGLAVAVVAWAFNPGRNHSDHF